MNKFLHKILYILLAWGLLIFFIFIFSPENYLKTSFEIIWYSIATPCVVLAIVYSTLDKKNEIKEKRIDMIISSISDIRELVWKDEYGFILNDFKSFDDDKDKDNKNIDFNFEYRQKVCDIYRLLKLYVCESSNNTLCSECIDKNKSCNYLVSFFANIKQQDKRREFALKELQMREWKFIKDIKNN